MFLWEVANFAVPGTPTSPHLPRGQWRLHDRGPDPPSISTGERALAGERDGARRGPRGHAHHCSDGHQEEWDLPGMTALAFIYMQILFLFPDILLHWIPVS